MFHNEYAVTIQLVGGEILSLFADENLVSANGSRDEGYLIVNIVEAASGEQMVLLPTEALEKGTRWVQVPPEQIQHR